MRASLDRRLRALEALPAARLPGGATVAPPQITPEWALEVADILAAAGALEAVLAARLGEAYEQAGDTEALADA